MSDRPRRDAALAALDASGIDTALLERLVEAQKAKADAAAANSPETLLEAEGAAVSLAVDFLADWLGDFFARRYGSAANGRTPFDARVAHPDAVAAGRAPFSKAALDTDPDAMYLARNVVARVLSDFKRVLPPGLAKPFAVQLHLLNLGETATMVGQPTRFQGQPEVSAFRAHVDAVLLDRIYYYKAYHGCPNLPSAAAKVLPDDRDGKRWDALQQARHRRANLLKICDRATEKGKEDRAAGRPFDPPLMSGYNVAELEALGQKLF